MKTLKTTLMWMLRGACLLVLGACIVFAVLLFIIAWPLTLAALLIIGLTALSWWGCKIVNSICKRIRL